MKTKKIKDFRGFWKNFTFPKQIIILTLVFLLVISFINADYGDGSDGALTITASTIVNNYSIMLNNVTAGGIQINVSQPGYFAVGDEILIIQIQNFSGGKAGQYEFVEISEISGDSLTVEVLTYDYYVGSTNQVSNPPTDTTGSTVTQVVRVPEYTSVDINAAGNIIAQSWNGTEGSIVVFRASGTVTINGTIDVEGKGFRGGQGGTTGHNHGYDGEGFHGDGAIQTDVTDDMDNWGGASGTSAQYNDNCGGAGGCYGTAGTIMDLSYCWWPVGAGNWPTEGRAYGGAVNETILLGGGGGPGDDENGADDNADFKIRFSCVGSGPTERCRVDNASVAGVVPGFFSSGVYVSKVFNSSKISEWANLTWSEQIEASTDMVLQIRSCDDSLCSGELFVGPDNTANTNFTDPLINNKSNNISFIPDNQYFQFEAFFSTTDFNITPGLFDVSIDYKQNAIDGSFNITSSPVEDSLWHHVAITFDDSIPTNNFNLFIDGNLDASTTEHRLPTELANNLYIGKDYQNTSYFNGALDEFRIYNYALTTEQIENNHLLNYNKIVSTETTREESYVCSITPNDGEEDGNTLDSSTLTIRNYIPSPSPTLLSPDNGYTSGALPEFNWTESYDAIDNDAVYYIIQIDNNSDFSSIDYTNNTLSEPRDINVVLDPTKIDTYWWRVLATDNIGNSSWSENRTFTYASWNITFNITSGELDVGELSYVNITSCDYTGFVFDGDTTNPYGPYVFPPGSWECSFERNFYFDKTKTFIADSDKMVDVTMSIAGYISYEEHTWLEALYNCIILKDCDLYDLLLEINQTVSNTWQHIKPTDESVITSETQISNTLNSTSNITYQYKINIPIKAGYSLGAYLPVRIGFWFMNESNESCYSQGTLPSGVTVIEPYCNPLMVETLGPMGGSVNFKVNLRPNLTAGTYNVKRTIEIDPDEVWENYGQEVVDTITVTEDMTDSGSVALDKTGETMPSTSSDDSSSSSSASGGGGGGGGSVTNIINIYNITNIIKESEEKDNKEGAEGKEEQPQDETKSKEGGLAGITGGAIANLPKPSPLVGSLIVMVIVIGGLVGYFHLAKKK